MHIINKLVSIVVPVYNSDKYLKECIESILTQTYKNFELIIINDGSIDNSLLICQEYSKLDARITIISQENLGVSVARNVGIEKLSGEYVVFVDSDDCIKSDYIEKLINVFQYNVDLSICDFLTDGKSSVQHSIGIMNQLQTFKGLYTRKKYLGFLFNKMFKADIIKENCINFDNKSGWCEDALFCTKYVSYITNAYYIDEPLYYYCIRDDSATHVKFNEKRFSVLLTYENIIKINKPIADKELMKRLSVNYTIHCVGLKRMLKNNKISNNSYEPIINAYIHKNFKNIFSMYMPVREKVKLLTNYL